MLWKDTQEILLGTTNAQEMCLLGLIYLNKLEAGCGVHTKK